MKAIGINKERITVEIAKDTYEKLKQEAKERDLTISGAVKTIFNIYFTNKEKKEGI